NVGTCSAHRSLVCHQIKTDWTREQGRGSEVGTSKRGAIVGEHVADNGVGEQTGGCQGGARARGQSQIHRPRGGTERGGGVERARARIPQGNGGAIGNGGTGKEGAQVVVGRTLQGIGEERVPRAEEGVDVADYVFGVLRSQSVRCEPEQSDS